VCVVVGYGVLTECLGAPSGSDSARCRFIAMKINKHNSAGNAYFDFRKVHVVFTDCME